MLYAFGSNGSGQLGILGRDDTNVPRECLFNEPIIQRPKHIAAGGNHTLVLFDSGVLYVAGSIDQPANEKKPEILYRMKLSSLDPSVKLCSATWDASMIVTASDEVYTFGNGSRGELGTGAISSLQPQRILGFPPEETAIVDIASSVSHTVAVLSNGEVYGWGNGRKGQLGQPAEIVLTPRKIKILNLKIVRAVCGREFTFMVTEPGDGRHIILGVDKWNIQSGAPTSVVGWKDIGASWGSIFIMKSSGVIESWGRNDRGQLSPRGLPEVERIAVGSEHVIAMSKCGQVLSWGWGEHGNCGANIDEMGNVKDKWNGISLDPHTQAKTAQGIGAGCATSFFWT